jgi:hypothetical protein
MLLYFSVFRNLASPKRLEYFAQPLVPFDQKSGGGGRGRALTAQRAGQVVLIEGGRWESETD